MKKFLIASIFFIPSLLFAQFGDYEMYGYGRLGQGFSMRDFSYTSTLERQAVENPVTSKLKLSGGVSTEVGIGLMVVRRFFVEANIGYTILNNSLQNSEDQLNYISSYKFNRTSVGVNWVYLVDVDPSFVLDFKVGFDAVFPNDLVVYTSIGEERVNYESSVELHGGFGGSYIHNRMVYGASLRYRFESFQMSFNQDLPSDFMDYNADLEEIDLKGVDIVFTVKYLF